ncbi:MAG: ATP-dependent helicase, partial [Pyrinomonadaceae bacterium]|nr:ATP-dependent helicase [Pyrinomonadaceae bacterium]
LFDDASNDDEILAAEKTLEVAKVYRFYDKLLRENGWLDFGDLLFRAVQLLQKNELARNHWQSKYSHVLVDEFQDVNRASGVLLREIAGKNGNLWVVGDARQTIYRWRGASTTNLQAFAKDFPDAASHSLSINYRSEVPVINFLNELAPNVTTSESFKGWRTPETETAIVEDVQKSRIRYIEADEFATEAGFIADEITSQNERGLKFKEQAVLGRTNNILAKIADELTRREIPILYLGNMFEREEIRDLLCLLYLTSPNSGRHLLRLTKIGGYDFDTKQIRHLIALAERTGKQFPDALDLVKGDSEITDVTRFSINSLKNQFADVDEKTTAWQFFSSYLFDRSDYLLPILRDDSVNGRQKRFAIYQLLQFAIAEATKNEAVRIDDVNPRKSFLRLIRHLAASGEEAAFRRLPSWAENIDAVRLLTVHAAKGLEFPTVFMPYLGNGYFPNKKRADKCPLPKSLLNEQFDDENAHESEELCLFFVAVSRAKNNLILSRSRNYGSSSKASRFFDLLPQNLPAIELFAQDRNLDYTSSQNVTVSTDGEHSNFYTFNELKTYHDCPRQYFYEYVLKVKGSHDEAIFLQFHACVRDVIYWAKNLRAANQKPELENAFAKLDEIWRTKPLHSHAYAPMYLDEARRLVERAVGFFANLTVAPKADGESKSRLEFAINGERVIITPDLLEISPDGATVFAQKIKTGRAKKTQKDLSPDDTLAIAALHQAVSETFSDAQTSVAFNYLASGDVLQYDPKNIKTQLKHLESSISGIRQRLFVTKTDSQKCPSCAHYFICPGGDY